ncbi:MAG: T9SS type B sorting domain-containing protein, partial [Gelidibacter sp.]|nr:T9SS type B sorting domain-containing protein [Gelidibacter sp.]
LYDFDNDTGIVSNMQELYGPNHGDSPYGVEFSAENKKVYATINGGANGAGPSSVLQWNLESADIPASLVVIHTSSVFSAGALQLGINKKIYRAQVNLNNQNNSGRYLGVIQNPEADGMAANYDETGILVDINGDFQHLSRIGLPPFIQSLFNSEIDIIQNGISTTELKLCDGDTYTLTAVDIPGGDYTWSKDGVALTETTFQLQVDTPGFYEVFIEPNNGECPIEGQAVVGVFDIPVAHQPNNIIHCDATTTSSFDFTTQNTDVLGAQDPTIYEVKYFTSLDDATNNTNEIIGNFSNTSNPQDIFVRVQNSENPNCFDTTSFSIETFITPTISTLNDIEICDSDVNANTMDGFSTFDLSEINSAILGTQDANLYTISYHNSQQDADANIAAFPNLYTNTTAYNQTVFVRIENNNNTNCYTTGSFTITINDAPIANNTTLIQCDEDGIPEGFTIFNFNQIVDDITGGFPDRTVNYYLSQNDAINATNEINGDAFHNFFNPQTIYAKVTNDVTGCYNIAELTLQVSLTNANNTSLKQCDDDGTEDGFYSFNLTNADADVLNGLPAGLDLNYYETYEDALLEQNPLPTNFTNTTAYSQSIFARVENANACFGISQVQLTVFKLPNIETAFETLYCLNFFPEAITLTGGVIDDSPSNYYYTWSTGEDTSEIMVNTPGTYTVRVTNTNGCFKDRTITVLPSNIATITNIEVTDASQNNSISVFVTGEGDYQYALDAVDALYQDSNTFENVAPGLHTIYVRDKNDCGVIDSLVSVIGFPKYFTPNNDGFHDFWQVYGITDLFQPNTNIYIFDRQGKLIKELDPLSAGWDGTLNGYKLPASDYWFKVKLQDGRIFKNHFTLKR